MKPRMLITGGAGVIGNAACEHYRDRYNILAVDNLSRPTAQIPRGVAFEQVDVESVEFNIRTYNAMWSVVLHLAGQVSVTASYADPRKDLETNILGSVNVAQWTQCAEHGWRPQCFIYSSSNKVYGEMAGNRCPTLDNQPIHPQTPYGISKAAGGLYIRDLLPDTSFDFRQSCIYGETQVGTEDQGWIGYLRHRIEDSQPITCYGDGNQVRDLLHVSDLLTAYDYAIDGKLTPGSYAVGGGPENAVSFLEAVELLGGTITNYAPKRPHDQDYFVAASDGLRVAGWKPQVDAREWLTRHAVKHEVVMA